MFEKWKEKRTESQSEMSPGKDRTLADSILSAFNDVQKKMIWTAAFWLIILVVVGLLLLIRPEAAMLVICRVIGAMVMLYGFILLIRFALSGFDSVPGVELPSLFLGILLTTVGFYIARTPEILVNIVAVILAIFLLTHGIFSLVQMLRLKFVRDVICWISLVGSALTIVFGLIFLFAPLEGSRFAMQIAGISLIYAALAGFLLALRAQQAVKHVGDRVGATVREVQDEYERRMNVDEYGREIIDEDDVVTVDAHTNDPGEGDI